MDDDDVSTKSITIFIIELGIWVIRASGNLGCNGGTFFGGGRLQWIMMMWLDIERGNKGFWQCWQTEMDLLKGNNSAFWCYMYFWCQLFQVMISFGGLARRVFTLFKPFPLILFFQHKQN